MTLSRGSAAFLAISLFIWPQTAPQADYQTGLVAYGKGDYETAFQQWVPLAETGSDQAQFNLAFMYDNGQGVSHDYRAAASWYYAAANQGHPDAAWNLGMMYVSGQGVHQDYFEAYKWLSISALSGNVTVDEDLLSVADLLTTSQLDQAELWLQRWTTEANHR